MKDLTTLLLNVNPLTVPDALFARYVQFSVAISPILGVISTVLAINLPVVTAVFTMLATEPDNANNVPVVRVFEMILAELIKVSARSEAVVISVVNKLVTVWFVPTASVKRSVLAVKLVMSIFVAVIFVASKFVRVSFVPIAFVKRSVLVVKLVLRMFVAVTLFVAILGELTEVVTFRLPASEILMVVRVST